MAESSRGRWRRRWEGKSSLLASLSSLLVASQLLVEGAGTVQFLNGRPVDADIEDAVTVFAADLDGDEDLDILAGTRNWLSWYENLGNGSFAEAIVIAASVSALSIAVGDLDGDGSPDLVIADHHGHQITWFRNLGGVGGFSAGVAIDTDVYFASNVKLGDIDDDGDLDVIAAIKLGNRVTWYENTDGEGTFAFGVDLSTAANEAYALAIADIDGDEDLDIVAASTFISGAEWFENSDGKGAFSPAYSLEPANPSTGAMDVVAEDFDGDGDIDIFAFLYDGSHDNDTSWQFPEGRLVWFENTDGAGSFASGKDFALLDSARSVVAVDLDDDGDFDLVASDFIGGSVVWYENTDGKGSFSAAIDIAFDPGVHGVVAADLDGDGDLDLVSANYAAGRVVWYENLLADTEETTEGTTPAPLAVPTSTPGLSAPEPPTPAPSPAERSVTPTPPPASPIDDTPAPIDASAPIDAPTGVDPASGNDDDGEPGENYLVEILVSVVSGLILAAIAGLWKWWFRTPPTPTVPN